VGEAKKKAARLSAWRNGLSDAEKVVVKAATQTYERFIVATQATGMCYRMAFFLSTYLRCEHAITAPAIVGYVHDGTGDVMTSHAWIEFNGKKTDISLTMTDEPSVQLQGQLIVLDQVLTDGHAYTYHRAQNDAALRALETIHADPRFRPLAARKDREHEMMTDIARDPDRMLSFLNGAPDGFDYAELVRTCRL
jgi:hypothetical protein